MSQNHTLIGCLAKTGQDWHLKIERSKPHFILQSFLTRNIASPTLSHLHPQGKYLWQGLVKTPQALIFFLIPPTPPPPPFQNLGLKAVPPAERRRLILCTIKTLSNQKQYLYFSPVYYSLPVSYTISIYKITTLHSCILRDLFTDQCHHFW